MKHWKLFLAFGFGWMTVAAFSLGADALAEHRGDVHISSIQSRINALQQRVSYVEQQASKSEFTKTVVAPFEVVNRAGQRIFYVSPDRDVEVWSGSKRAVMSAGSGGVGSLWSYSANPQSWASLSPRGVFVNENGKYRIDLGKDLKKGNYRLVFYNDGDKMTSAIGVSSVTNAGIALVSDGSGNKKADMAATINNTGVVEVLRSDGFVAARLTEGDQKAAALFLCSANSCDPPMVSAGTNESGVGVVATGPHFYLSGPTGAPGSFLIGKRQ